MDFSRHVWLVFVAVVLANAMILSRRARSQNEAHPELANGYRRLIRGFVFWMSLPFLVMGFGCEIGGVPTVMHFFFPAVFGPFVWAFWVVFYVELLLLGYWAVFRNGAETLVRHPGIVEFRTKSVSRMRFYIGWIATIGVASNAGFLVYLAQQ
jgi:hypothetical protein